MDHDTTFRALGIALEASAAWQSACEHDTHAANNLEKTLPEVVRLLDQLHEVFARNVPDSYSHALRERGQGDLAEEVRLMNEPAPIDVTP